jgi:hypothetical protein
MNRAGSKPPGNIDSCEHWIGRAQFAVAWFFIPGYLSRLSISLNS